MVHATPSHARLPERTREGLNLQMLQLTPYRPEQAFRAPGRLRLPEFLDNRHMKVVRLSTVRTGSLYPQETFLVLISVRG